MTWYLKQFIGYAARIVTSLVMVFTMSSTLFCQNFGKEMLGGEHRKVIPFEYRNGFIVVDVICGFFPLNFLFDTGAEHTILFDKVYTDLMGIPYDQRIRIYGADLENEMYALVARNIPFTLVGTNTVVKDFVVLEQDIYNFQEITGVEIDGILGGEYLRNLVVKIDYKKKEITLQDPDRFKAPKDYDIVETQILRNKPYIDVSYLIRSGSTTSLRLLLDSGASLNCLIHQNTHEDLTVPNLVQGHLGKGLGGIVSGFMGKIDKLSFGQFDFRGMVANFQEIDSSRLALTEITRNGLLGNVLLERFDIIIDYVHGKSYWKATKDYNKGFKYDMSGLLIFAVGRNLNQYYVRDVLLDSPAWKAGIRKGDYIQKIGCWPSRWYSLTSISNKLSSEEGKRIKMKIKRGTESFKTEFRLVDLFKG